MFRKYWGRLNFETLVIITILLTDTGHTGSYLATFEVPYLRWLGYVQALTIDAAALICAYRMRRKSQRKVAVAAWAFFCAVTALLNSMYYVNAGVTIPLAAALGCWSPVAVLLVGWLKANTDAVENKKARAAETRARKRADKPKTVRASVTHRGNGRTNISKRREKLRAQLKQSPCTNIQGLAPAYNVHAATLRRDARALGFERRKNGDGIWEWTQNTLR